MPNNPFLKPCKNCNGSGQTGWFFQEKKTCKPCGGTGYGEPNAKYWDNFLHSKLEQGTRKTTVSNLPHLESGIAAIESLLKVAPENEGTHFWLIRDMYSAKGNILWDMARTQKNQHILFLEAIEYLRKAEKRRADNASQIESVKMSFLNECSPDEQKAAENLYKRKYPNKEIPS